MPRLQYVLNSFGTGEISPRLLGRVDLAKYKAACDCLHNYLVLVQGGVTRRPGFRYVATAKTPGDGCVRLIAFQPSATQAYIIEAGCLYFRMYRNQARLASGGSPVEVTTPYTITDLPALTVVPSIDVLYLMHPNYATRKLEHYSDSTWKLRTVTFTPPPSLEFGHRPGASVQASAVSGDGVSLTAFNCNAFLASDVGREVLITGGANAGARAGIAGVTNSKLALINVCVAFANTNVICTKLWKIAQSPLTGVTPGAHIPVGKSTTLTADANAWRGGVSGFGDPNADNLTDSDCGRFVLLNGGSFEITAVGSATAATATIRGTAAPDTAAKAESGNWTLEEPLFSSCNGFAEGGAFHDGRFYLFARHRFAGSKVGDFENHGAGSQDDDGVLFAMDSEELEQIRWMHGRTSLLIGTMSGEWEAIGSTDAPISPSNVQVRRQTTFGSSAVAPLHVAHATLFVDRSGRSLRELAFTFETDSFQAPDLLLLAEHLTRRQPGDAAQPTITQIAYQREPESRLWAVRSDGVLLCCTYMRAQELVAWSRITTQGLVESVAVIPHPNGGRDQVWIAVQRTVNGAVTRYIEYLDDDGLFYLHLNVDAAYTCEVSVAQATFTGLDHLNGLTVDVVADGSVRPQATVSGGAITLAAPCAKNVEVGLHYTSDLTTVRPEIAVGGQSSTPSKMKWARLFIRMLDTLGMVVATGTTCDEIIPFRTPQDCMGFAPALFTGQKELPKLGWGDGTVTVRQTQPLPSTVLSIGGVIDLGGVE